MEDTRITLFRQGDGGVFGFRIPAILTLASGRVLTFCEARRDSLKDSGRIDIVMRAGDGERFGPMRVAVSGGGHTVGNPSPVQDPATGRVFLLYNANDADRPEAMILKGQGSRTVHMVYSDDEGETWSSPRDLTAQVKLPRWTWYAIGPCHGAALPGGRLAFGCNHASLDEWAGDRPVYRSHLLFSDDHGETWHIGPSLGQDTNECSLAAYADGGLLISMRRHPADGCRALAYSADGGEHWGETALRGDLPDPGCQGSTLTVNTRRGEETLLCNAAASRRERLTLRRSLDRGINWETEGIVTPGPAAYSDLALLKDGRVALLCECGEASPYERIDLHVFALR